MDLDLAQANSALQGARPQDILAWGLTLPGKAIVTTNFGPYSAVTLHQCVQLDPHIPVLWVDSGYNTRKTYLFAQRMIHDLGLNIQIYNPRMSAARRDALMGVPDIDDPDHEAFTDQVKLEPFRRAFDALAPTVWITGVRREQSAFRRDMEIVSQERADGVIKVAPLLDWSEANMKAYLLANGLPNENDYFDPTKVRLGRECGLHNRFTA
ncbi:MAG: phosphoadenosine phosphosulfate reductase family protein [Salinisphaera sp.]|nr:phosphoadenosine phosphosulfate reductase family protein [Salinisphaera sp.]MDN5937029.1 phosphoadenosine phosphosulfate reductase family protein [Salinisphaera sp.]